MTTAKAITTLRPFLIAALLLTPKVATAHDDGLTCHSHPVSVHELGHILQQGTSSTNLEALAHSFDNLIAADPSRYDADDVLAARLGLGEFGDMVESVRLLVLRAERLADPQEADEALEGAEMTFLGLPLNEVMAFEDFAKENRQGLSVVISMESLSQYLGEISGVSEEIVVAIEGSAAGCP